MRSFPIWKTVTLGTTQTHDALRRALLNRRYVRFFGDRDEQRSARTIEEFDKLLEELLVRTPLTPQRTPVDLVRATLDELGYTHKTHPTERSRYGTYRRYLAGPDFHEIADRIWRLGYRLCPAEVALRLRLQYPRQPRGEMMNVAMEPIVVSDKWGGYPHIYQLFYDGVGKSITGKELKYSELSPDEHWVFVKPRIP
ncbi:MAG: hypothetical protein Q7S02_04400 [bacterium]|nr:hypothetical protein [bacterium]